MSRIATRGPLGLKPDKAAPKPRKAMRRKPKKVDPYDTWMHANCTCVVTGQPEFEDAHTGGLSEGKGTAIKANRNTMLPLIAPLHWYEEKNRKTFWPTVGLPDHLDIAADLFKAFTEGRDPTEILTEAQGRVDRDYVRAILGEVDF